MSETCDLLCIRCGERAPEIGDFGYIGYPSLSQRARVFGPQSFGYIYRGLAAVSLLPAEVEAFHAYLVKHRGHRLLGTADMADADEGNAFANARLWLSIGLSLLSHPTLVFRHGLQGTMELLLGGPDEEPVDVFALVPEAEFSSAHYRMTCADCGSAVVTENFDNLRIFERRTVAVRDLELFEQRVLSLDVDDIYRATPLIDPAHDLDPFKAFVRRHREHRVEVDLVPTDTSG